MKNLLGFIFNANNSKRFTIDARDIVNSVYYFVGTSVAAAIMPNIEKLTMPTVVQIKVAVGAGLVAGFQHLIRKYFTEVKVNIENLKEDIK